MIIICVILVIISFVVALRVNYHSKNKQSLILIYDTNCYHIHHWILYSFIIAIIFLARKLKIHYIYCIVAILLGQLFEGFMFSDFYIIKDSCGKEFEISPTAIANHKTNKIKSLGFL